ncbi:XRE family transcriptional regulator [Streptomyces platensis]|uniref:Helix-turn-helix protein n=1 Tax=Streptomyces platensis TaxID=58346 RepID=A0AAE6NFD6_STRPT|nr:helix-turn-helix transcriptional regulator [Streptomyces platensis]OSY46363.1 Helix-turn-helix protein [Streptomyces platensis]QEV51131.1 XRE family transcriptional regulator [Streptomyces platensis]BCK72839.1 transcriptional regulator [Streptomyces libani subsp. rufus]
MSDGTELGRFLRARRGQIRPQDVGLPVGTGIRRTPGLRREELATLAGVSVDYYTRLERGRETRPSPAVVAALGEVLRLSDDALHRLHELVALAAGQAPPPSPGPARAVREPVRALLETLRPSPAYVVSRTNDLLAANRPGLRLHSGITDWPRERRNITRYMFLHPMGRRLYRDWEEMAAHSVAHLRAIAGADPDMPELAQLVGELVVKSPEFARLWERYEVRARGGGHKHFQHPEVGSMSLTFEVMAIFRTDGQRLVVYQAPTGTADHDAMLLLDMASPEEAALVDGAER